MMKNSLFSYKPGNSFLHRLPVAVKLILIPCFNVFVFFFLPAGFAAGLFFLQFAVSLFLHFKLQEITTDLKPVVIYAVLSYGISFVSTVCSCMELLNTAGCPDLVCLLKTSARDVFLNAETASMFIKYFCIMQSASLIFKTSTSLEIRQGICSIESFIRKRLPVSKENRFTDIISLFITFIPMVARVWAQEKKAWTARNGKKNLKMIVVLIPVLFSVTIKQAFNTVRALEVRL